MHTSAQQCSVRSLKKFVIKKSVTDVFIFVHESYTNFVHSARATVWLTGFGGIIYPGLRCPHCTVAEPDGIGAGERCRRRRRTRTRRPRPSAATGRPTCRPRPCTRSWGGAQNRAARAGDWRRSRRRARPGTRPCPPTGICCRRPGPWCWAGTTVVPGDARPGARPRPTRTCRPRRPRRCVTRTRRSSLSPGGTRNALTRTTRPPTGCRTGNVDFCGGGGGHMPSTSCGPRTCPRRLRSKEKAQVADTRCDFLRLLHNTTRTNFVCIRDMYNIYLTHTRVSLWFVQIFDGSSECNISF